MTLKTPFILLCFATLHGVVAFAQEEDVDFAYLGESRALRSGTSIPRPQCSRERNLPEDEQLFYCPIPGVGRFRIINVGSPRVNPVGQGVSRQYEFFSPSGVRRETRLEVYDFAARFADEDTADSHVSMYSDFIFFPRRVTPSIRKSADGQRYEVRLPTGERVDLDARTHEIISGVLRELGPIDINPNRFKRKFAAIEYSGTGLAMRTDQRGNTTRAAEMWGEKKSATFFRNRGGVTATCKIPVGELFDQAEMGFPFRFPEDEALYLLVEKRCKWNLDDLRAATGEAKPCEEGGANPPISPQALPALPSQP